MLKEEGWLPTSDEIYQDAARGCRDPRGQGMGVTNYLYPLREQGKLRGRKQCEEYIGKAGGWGCSLLIPIQDAWCLSHPKGSERDRTHGSSVKQI